MDAYTNIVLKSYEYDDALFQKLQECIDNRKRQKLVEKILFLYLPFLLSFDLSFFLTHVHLRFYNGKKIFGTILFIL